MAVGANPARGADENAKLSGFLRPTALSFATA
jgi:hypothetical protein